MGSDWLAGQGDYLIFALGAGAVFAGLARVLRRREMPARLPRLVWAALAAMVLVGFFLVDAAGSRPQQRVVELLQGLAPTYATELERMGHATLRVEDAAEDPRYPEMIEAMKRWARLNPRVSDISTYRRAPGGGMILLVDAETDHDGDGIFAGEREERVRPGEPYPQAGESIRRAFAGEANFMTAPVRDRWGEWVAMHVPMRDARGRVEAVLGVDYPAVLWRAEAGERRRLAMVLVGGALLLLAGGAATLAVNRAELEARTAAEERLRRSDARLRAMLDHLPFALWLLDGEGRCLAHNARAAGTLGAVEGRTMDRFGFEPGERAALEEDVRRARAGAVVTRESTRGPEGARRQVFRLFAPVAEAPGSTGLVAVEMDVTDRVEAEEARRRSEQSLALHVQQMPLAYLEWGPDLRILRWNPAAERIFGYGVFEAMGRPFVELIVAPESAAEVAAACRRLFSGRGGEHGLKENRTRDGRVIVCEWQNTPLVDARGEVIAVASHVQDVTERVALEQRLRRTQRMESMGQLAGGVAHEFNNLLTPMLMQMGQIASRYAGDGRLLAMLRPVEDSIQQAAQLNQRILAVGRKSTDTPGLLELNPLVREAADLLRHTLDRRIELQLELGERLPAGLLTKGAVTQLVMNLTLNARDALLERLEAGAPAGWRPRLRIASSHAAQPPASAPDTLRRAPGCLVLVVEDNGGGMSEEVKRRAFEPFFTTKAAGKGTGLGLAVVWSVVESLGGVIELRSAENAGTTFTLHLPVGRPEDVPVTESAPLVPLVAPQPTERLKIALVEDNELVRETLREVLVQCGHQVDTAVDGEDGLRLLEAAAEGPYDVLIADLNMPRLSGRAMIERVRGRGLVRGVLVVSGLVDPGLGEDLRRIGADRVLRKPVGMADLLAAVSEVRRRAVG
jgi:PAS domain S-box-containing protein